VLVTSRQRRVLAVLRALEALETAVYYRSAICRFLLVTWCPRRRGEITTLSESGQSSRFERIVNDRRTGGVQIGFDRLETIPTANGHGYDRAALIEEARIRTNDASETTAAVPSLDRLDLQTAAEIRRQTEADIEERFEAGRWDVRARRLGKLGALAFILPALYLLYAFFGSVLPVLPPPAPSLIGRLIGSLWILGFGGFFGWALIMAAKAVKYELLPTVGKLVNHPDKVVREVFEKLIKNPRETVRESWNEL
jgi:hypothetical protein